MYITSLAAVENASPLESDWRRLLAHLRKTAADNDRLPLAEIYTACGMRFAVWCLRVLPGGSGAAVRLLACDMAQTQMKWVPKWDKQPLAAIEAARAFAVGQTSLAKMMAAGGDADAGFQQTYHRANGYHWNAATAAAATCLPDAAMAADAVYHPAYSEDMEPIFKKWVKETGL